MRNIRVALFGLFLIALLSGCKSYEDKIIDVYADMPENIDLQFEDGVSQKLKEQTLEIYDYYFTLVYYNPIITESEIDKYEIKKDSLTGINFTIEDENLIRVLDLMKLSAKECYNAQQDKDVKGIKEAHQQFDLIVSEYNKK